VRHQIADEVVPAAPVAGRRDDPPVVEDRPIRLGREVVGHERQLDDRSKPGLEEPLVDLVNLREVVDGTAVDLAVDGERVVQDSVRPDHLDTELAPCHPERLGQLLADVPATRPGAAEEQGEVLGTDHRPPRTRQGAEDPGGIDLDGDPALDGRRHRADRGRQLPRVRLDRGQGRHGVPRVGAWTAGRVDVGRMRDGENVPATMVDRLERPVGPRAAVDQVPGRAVDGCPVDRHLAASTLGPDSLRRWKLHRRSRRIALGLGAERLEPGDPCRACARRPEGVAQRRPAAARRGPALKVSIEMIGWSAFRNAFVAKASRSMSPARALPIAAMTMPWSSER
jgi:hypothetical protein